MTEPKITPEIISKHGITPDEYERIKGILGREPNFTELGIFSVMWSEHCSYKNSKPELKKFPTSAPHILVKAGEENAGVVDIGDGWAIAFKIESHNHPSAVEPFQGAATGVGGIIRDIFTMGARPVCNLNSLRFGAIEGDSATAKNNRRLFAGVVAGIAHYGNCIGIPTIGGEVYFDESYEGNPLVNAFCLGVLRHEQIAKGAAKGVGNPVFYVGSETGRDGLAGAAFASRELTEESKEDRPAVQVGDPFKEKLLLEACLELLAVPDAVAGIQDMGAAGLTCSTCETASRGGTGVEIDLAKVPQREPGMTPYETMLSESQERMLIIVNKGHEHVVKSIFEKWDLPYAEIGVVTNDGMMRVKNHGVLVAEIPARQLAEDAPIYHREAKEPAYLAKTRSFDPLQIPEPSDYEEILCKLLSSPTIASKNWVYRQYDHMVRDGTIVPPGSDAAVFRINEADKIIALATDCNSTYVYLDPYEGGKTAVAECCRNLVCSGAQPLASTDNLNFGNPHKPENFWQLQKAVEGLAEACIFFNTPVTGGNVSLYNESPTGAIDPTPTMSIVGLIDNPDHITTQYFKNDGDLIFLVGELGHELGGTHYLKRIHNAKAGHPPRLDFKKEKGVQDVVLSLIRAGAVNAAHDCSEGGLLVALAEMGISNGENLLGAKIALDDHSGRIDVLFFNESQSRIIVTCKASDESKLRGIVEKANVPLRKLGEVGGDKLEVSTHGKLFVWDKEKLRGAWYNAINQLMA